MEGKVRVGKEKWTGEGCVIAVGGWMLLITVYPNLTYNSLFLTFDLILAFQFTKINNFEHMKIQLHTTLLVYV